MGEQLTILCYHLPTHTSRTDLIFSMAEQSPAWVQLSLLVPNACISNKSSSRSWRFSGCSIPRPVRNRRVYGFERDIPLVWRQDRRLDQSRSVMRQMCARLAAIFFQTSSANNNSVGKTLAFTSINFSNSKGEVFARGSHTKYVALAWKDPNNIVEELSPKPSEKKE